MQNLAGVPGKQNYLPSARRLSLPAHGRPAPSFKTQAQRDTVMKTGGPLARQWESRYGSDAARSTKKTGTPRRKMMLSALGGGYRGVA